MAKPIAQPRTFDPDRTSIIPTEMRARDQWICWRLEAPRKPGGKPVKVPTCANNFDPGNIRNASSNNRKTWSAYATALATYQDNPTVVAGVGYTFDNDFIGVDLDGCRDRASGKVAAWAEDIVQGLNSYTEVSVGQQGLHVITKGALPGGHGRSKKSAGTEVAVYAAGRYFTMTGALYKPAYDRIIASTKLMDIYHEVFDGAGEASSTTLDRDAISAGSSAMPSAWAATITLDPAAAFDNQRVSIMCESDSRFMKSWLRDRPDFTDQSPSAYCLSLASMCVLGGWSDQAIVDLLVGWRRMQPDAEFKKTHGWYWMTLNKAREPHEKKIIEIARNQAIDHLGNVDLNDREAVLETIHRICRLPIVRVWQEGLEDAGFSLELADGTRRFIGTAAKLRSQARWMDLCADYHRGAAFHPIKVKQWFEFLDAVSAICEVKPHRESSITSKIESWLAEYLKSALIDAPERKDQWRAVAVASRAFQLQGYWHINATKFGHAILQIHRDKTITQTVVVSTLRILGWQRKSLTFRHGGNRFCRSFWLKQAAGDADEYGTGGEDEYEDYGDEGNTNASS